MSAVVDLGAGHTLRWLAWAPDRALNPQWAHLPDVPHYGATVAHPLRDRDTEAWCREMGHCEGVIIFAGPVQQAVQPQATVWDVASWEPLTITPSLLCNCGDHGFITAGRWQVA